MGTSIPPKLLPKVINGIMTNISFIVNIELFLLKMCYNVNIFKKGCVCVWTAGHFTAEIDGLL